MPKVSILMAVYNERTDFLDKAILSIIMQSIQTFEFVIVDDGSTDINCINRLRYWASKDERIVLHVIQHGGLTKALNYGLANCRGQIIFRQDSDDWSDPNRLNKQLNFMSSNPSIALLGTSVYYHTENGEDLWPVTLPHTNKDIRESFKHGSPFAHGSVCFRKSIISEFDWYREEVGCAEDYDLFIRISEKYNVTNLEDNLYHYRFTRGSICTQRAAEQLMYIILVRKLAKNRSQGKPECMDTVAIIESKEYKKLLPRYFLRQFDRIMLAGFFADALRGYIKYLRDNPLSLEGWAKFARILLAKLFPKLAKILF